MNGSDLIARLILYIVAMIVAMPCRAASPGERLSYGRVVVKVCEDAAEWPPYSYYERVNGQRTSHIVGAAVEVLDSILDEAHIDHTLEFLPWARCQAAIRHGSYQLALNGSYSDQRAIDYMLTRPYYWLNSHYYYSRHYHPHGLQIDSIADLKHYRVCGLRGYNYATYGLEPKDMDLSDPSFPQLIAKLEAGRCDLFVEKREIIAGFALIDPAMALALANPDLAHAPVPGVPPTPFHMMVSRAVPWGRQLVDVLNAGIARLQQSGDMQHIMDKYVN